VGWGGGGGGRGDTTAHLKLLAVEAVAFLVTIVLQQQQQQQQHTPFSVPTPGVMQPPDPRLTADERGLGQHTTRHAIDTVAAALVAVCATHVSMGGSVCWSVKPFCCIAHRTLVHKSGPGWVQCMHG